MRSIFVTNKIGVYFLLTIPLAWVFWISMTGMARGIILVRICLHGSDVFCD